MQVENNNHRLKISLIIILTGIIFRVSQYIYNRSLTEGEAPLAMNIIERGYSELAKPLDYVQAAPIGFLYIEKLMVSLLGNNEYALRLFPLLTSILALFIFSIILRTLGDRKTEFFALLLFALNDQVIYFASEVKPYSSDVFFALLLMMLSLQVVRKNHNLIIIMLWGIIGAISIWFSFPSVFVFTGTALVVVPHSIKKDMTSRKILAFLSTAIIWLSSHLANYTICLQYLTKHYELHEFWSKSFLHLTPQSFNDLYQSGYFLIRVFKNPGCFPVYVLFFAIILSFFGFIKAVEKNSYQAVIVAVPLFATMFGSHFQLYPFEGRLLLFLTPSILVFVASGLAEIYEIARRDYLSVAVLLTAILLTQPLALALYRLIIPRAPEELRTVLNYVQQHRKEHDTIYVYYGALNAFRYYKDRFPGIGNNFISGTESRHNWQAYYRDIDRLKGNNRVWFLFSHVARHLGADEERLYISYLNYVGTPIDSFRTAGASAYLYDLER